MVTSPPSLAGASSNPWLPWAIGVACILAGWLTPAQVAVTIALELAVASYHARRRTELSEGIVLRDRGTVSSNGYSVTPRAGERLSPTQRSFYGRSMQQMTTIATVVSTGCVIGLTGSAGITPASSAGWLSWTAFTLISERRRFAAWAASDAPASADPGSHTSLPFTRATILFLAVFPASWLTGEGGTVLPALVLLSADVACIHLWTRREARLDEHARPAKAAEAAQGTPPRLVHRRLPPPPPDWTPAPGWAPPPGWYGTLPGWEQDRHGSWVRTDEHPWGAT